MQRWPTRALPTNLSPVGTRCIQITIPDDDDWERAMYAEVSTLAQWMRWQRDLGHNGKPVADIWLKALKTWQHCDGSPSPVHGMEQEDFMPLRVDCDCNVWITCCDGTEKQLLTADQVEKLLAGQPGGGSPQPAPGGGCQQYPAQLLANGRWLVPTVVSTGDTIEIGSAVGATNDGAELIWHCPDGKQFFAGACVASGGLDGSDPLPTVEHMRLIANIDGSYYDAMSGPITVGAGVSNAQVYIQVNDSDLTDNTGQVQFVVTACNNQLGTFAHHFSLQTTDGGFTALSDGSTFATWLAANGWIQANDTLGSCSGHPPDRALLWISRAMPSARFLNTIRIVGQTSTDLGPGSGARQLYIDGAGSSLGIDSNVGPFDITLPINANVATDFSILINSICVAPGSTITVSDVYLTGQGSDPF